MVKVLAGRRKVRDIFDALTEMWGWKGMDNRGVNLEKQEKLNLKSKTGILAFPSNWSLYTWLPCWHVYKTTWHVGQQLSNTNGAFGRKDYFDRRLLNSRIKSAFRWIGGHFCPIRENSGTNLGIHSICVWVLLLSLLALLVPLLFDAVS